MAQGQQSNQALVPQARGTLDRFKYEVAGELNINPEYQTGYWGNIPARECGAVGGHMVRRMIAAAEQSLLQQQGAGLQQAFRQAAQPLQSSQQQQ